MSDNQADNKNNKPEEKTSPASKVKKPLNPLAQKPGQNYATKKFTEKPQIETGTEK